MTQDMPALLRVLEEELKLYKALADCLARQRDALVRLDSPCLNALTLELDALICDVRRVSSSRAEMVQRAARDMGRKGDSLRDLAEAAPEPYRVRFAALRRDLLAQVRGMEGLAGMSRTLIEDSLGHIRAFVKLLAGLGGPAPVYANPRMARRAMVDRKA